MMKNPLHLWLLCALLLGVGSGAWAQGTAFTYQGRLDESGNPANGSYDVRFSIYDAAGSGALVAGPVTNSAVAVSNGLIAAVLDFGTNVFTGPARWLDIGIRPHGFGSFTTVAPRLGLTPSPYAIFAGTSSNVITGSVVKSLNGLKDNVTLAAGANVTITPSGNTLTVSSTGGGSSIWSLNGSSAYYTAGTVGIGTSTPTAALDLSYYNGNALFYLTAPRPNLIFRDTIKANAQSVFGGWDGGFRFYTENFWGAGNPNSLMVLDTNANLGIGVISPQCKIDVDSGNVSQSARLRGPQPYLSMIDSANGYESRIQANGGDVILLTQGALGGGLYPNAFLRLRGNGNVGIGTAAPVSTLDVRGSVTIDAGGSATLYTGSDPVELNRYLNVINAPGFPSASGVKAGGVLVADSYAYANPAKNDLIVKGNVGIGTAAPVAKLDVRGTTRTCILTISGGCDVAEPFPVGAEFLPEGSVVVIDEFHPGQLKLSDEPYDTRVAGIISGANGIHPGISLHQEGTFDDGQNVALTGRVYVRADAAYGAIRPGDLLTTSSTPGHAMKVTDHAKAVGAILGKAMSGLSDGKGMVLVLVTLQ
jgi:hypothetical protein